MPIVDSLISISSGEDRMDNCHQESRRAAAQSFMQSLTQLEATLLETMLLETTPSETAPPLKSADSAPAVPPAAPLPRESPKFDSSFEEAAADIEQFIRERQQRQG
jgi:hypothetical protein